MRPNFIDSRSGPCRRHEPHSKRQGHTIGSGSPGDAQACTAPHMLTTLDSLKEVVKLGWGQLVENLLNKHAEQAEGIRQLRGWLAAGLSGLVGCTGDQPEQGLEVARLAVVVDWGGRGLCGVRIRKRMSLRPSLSLRCQYILRLHVHKLPARVPLSPAHPDRCRRV